MGRGRTRICGNCAAWERLGEGCIWGRCINDNVLAHVLDRRVFYHEQMLRCAFFKNASDREAIATSHLKKHFASEDLISLRELQQVSHTHALVKHFWEDSLDTIPTKLALIHSEVSEALEEFRCGGELRGFTLGIDGKPEGFSIELADIIIRVADLAEHFGIDLTDAVRVKTTFNFTRPTRHGGKKL